MLAANLRASIVVVGPVTKEIMEALKLSAFSIGMVTTIPLLCFSLGSLIMPKIAYRFGLEKTLLVSILFLTIGILIRSFGNISGLFLGAIILGLAITVANVLLPPFIKKYFPRKVGFVTAFYLGFINVFSAIAVVMSAKTAIVFSQYGWRASLGIWFILSVLALPFWVYIFMKKKKSELRVKRATEKTNRRIWHSKIAWYISVFMAMQSILYYVLAAWLPAMLQDWGMATDKTGWVLFYLQSSNVPALIITPFLATKKKLQLPLVVVASLFMLSGIGMIIFWKSTLIVEACILLGIAIAIVFAMATTFFVIKTKSVDDSVQLSGMAQAICYFITGCFPPLVGILYSINQSWSFSLNLLIIIPIIMLVTGFLSVRGKVIDLS